MSLYFAAALARTPRGWVGRELDLDEVEDLDALADLLRDVAGDEADTALLLLEEDDEYLAVVRVDGDREPRVFLSDERAVGHSDIARMLHEQADAGTDEDEEATRAVAEPGGDMDILADLGVPAPDLLALCAGEGMLPADVLTALCHRSGCLDALEELRGG